MGLPLDGGKLDFQGRVPPVALTIAGFDPSSGAGITADLKVFAAHGIFGVAAITALTVQSTQGVRRSAAVEASLVAETLRCLWDDVVPAGIKIGMLASREIVEEVAGSLEPAGQGEHPVYGSRVVLDPVLRSSSGRELLDVKGVEVLKRRLLANVSWITPNFDELEVLTGVKAQDRQAVARGARALRQMAAAVGNSELNVVVTGGHLVPPDDYLLTAAGEEHWLHGEHIATNATHGTGCAFSSALLCALIAGKPPVEAVSAAKSYVTGALRNAYPIGKGKGPMNHLYER
jgi:hydroxymethylpyrimidine/phosphomethylpyrimidine kinase